MAKNSSQNNKQVQKRKTAALNHVFRGCREPLLVPAPGPTPTTNAFYSIASSSGTSNAAWVLCPLGLSSVVYGGSTITNGSVGNVCGPPLRGLYNKATDFQMYRVTRAKVVFVGNQGSTVTGIITLAGYTDPSDLESITSAVNVAGPNSRTFDLSNAASRELSVSIPVDSSWKRVSSILSTVGNIYPFCSATATTVANVNTVSDVAFGAISYSAVNLASGQNVGSFYIDYDVEFKGVIDTAVNL